MSLTPATSERVQDGLEPLFEMLATIGPDQPRWVEMAALSLLLLLDREQRMEALGRLGEHLRGMLQ